MVFPSIAQLIYLFAALIFAYGVMARFRRKAPDGWEAYYEVRQAAGKRTVRYSLILILALFFQKGEPYLSVTFLCLLFLIFAILANLDLDPQQYVDDHPDWEDSDEPWERVRYNGARFYRPVNSFLRKINNVRGVHWKKPFVRKTELNRARLIRRLVVFAILALIALPWVLALLPKPGGSSMAEGGTSVGSETSVPQSAPATSSAAPSAATTASSAAPAADNCKAPAMQEATAAEKKQFTFKGTAGIEVCRNQNWAPWVSEPPNSVTLEAYAQSDGYMYCKITTDTGVKYMRTKVFTSSH